MESDNKNNVSEFNTERSSSLNLRKVAEAQKEKVKQQETGEKTPIFCSFEPINPATPKPKKRKNAIPSLDRFVAIDCEMVGVGSNGKVSVRQVTGTAVGLALAAAAAGWSRRPPAGAVGTRIRQKIDLNNDGYISKEEFSAAIRQLGFGSEGQPALTSDEIEVLVDSADKDGDGQLNYEEFCAFLDK